MEVRLILSMGFREALEEDLNELVRFGQVKVTHLCPTQLPEFSSIAYQNFSTYISISLARPREQPGLFVSLSQAPRTR